MALTTGHGTAVRMPVAAAGLSFLAVLVAGWLLSGSSTEAQSSPSTRVQVFVVESTGSAPLPVDSAGLEVSLHDLPKGGVISVRAVGPSGEVVLDPVEAGRRVEVCVKAPGAGWSEVPLWPGWEQGIGSGGDSPQWCHAVDTDAGGTAIPIVLAQS